ncbi:MAG: hypothetical protein AAB370_06895 [Verrucomicrobiota bacterium]
MKEIIELLSASLAPITAIVALSIAYRQYRLEQLKFRRELYEKRLAIYDSTMKLLSVVLRKGDVNFIELVQFLQETNQSRFLFGKEIADYLTDIYKKGVDLEYHQKMLREHSLPEGEERTKHAHESCELSKWFGSQLTLAPEKFSVHLGLDE